MIFVSAGHHPAAPGAKYEHFIEHDEAVGWAKLLVDALDEQGLLVPVGVLKTKVEFINTRSMAGDVAIEIHFNAAKDAEGNNVGRGCETLYYPGSTAGMALAECCQKALTKLFQPSRGVKEGWYHMNPAKGADFFLAKTSCPAVIIEPEFVHRHERIIENRDLAINLLADYLKEYIDGD